MHRTGYARLIGPVIRLACRRDQKPRSRVTNAQGSRPTPDSSPDGWNVVDPNPDPGFLRVGNVPVEVGEKIDIEGEPLPRIVTYAMGSAAKGTLCACFRAQGPVPTGKVRWRKLGTATGTANAAGADPTAWHTVQNRNTGSLRVGTVELQVGDRIQIRGEEPEHREVAYVMGKASHGTLTVCFKDRAVPTGEVQWRQVNEEEAPRERAPESTGPLPPFKWAKPQRLAVDEPTIVIGFDSAWSKRNRGAIAVALLEPPGTPHRILVPPTASTFDEAAQLIRDTLHDHPRVRHAILAIDQPTIVTNKSGRRPVDSIVAKRLQPFGTAVQPASLKRHELFGADAPIWRFLEELRHAEPRISLNPADIGCRAARLVVAEVYPVLATLAFFPELVERREVARYNPQRRSFRPEDWRRLCGGLANAFDRIRLPELSRICEDLASRKPTKPLQDQLDACLCLLIAHHLAIKAPSIVIGDTDTGCMVTPT